MCICFWWTTFRSSKDCLEYMTYLARNKDSRNVFLSYDLYFSCLFRTHHHKQKLHNQLGNVSENCSNDQPISCASSFLQLHVPRKHKHSLFTLTKVMSVVLSLSMMLVLIVPDIFVLLQSGTEL